jgi:hypothetical protein
VCDVGPADGGPVTPHAAHVSMTIPVMTQPAHRGKARTWNPLLIQVLANHHSTHARLHTQDREDASGPRDPVFFGDSVVHPSTGCSKCQDDKSAQNRADDQGCTRREIARKQAAVDRGQSCDR